MVDLGPGSVGVDGDGVVGVADGDGFFGVVVGEHVNDGLCGVGLFVHGVLLLGEDVEDVACGVHGVLLSLGGGVSSGWVVLLLLIF